MKLSALAATLLAAVFLTSPGPRVEEADEASAGRDAGGIAVSSDLRRNAQLLGSASLVQTARDTQDRLADLGDVAFSMDAPWTGVEVEVSTGIVHQEVLGFGGAFTESSAVVLQQLKPELQRELLERYFGPDGIGYTVGRVHINSCDFSVASYSFDDVPEDFDLQHFDRNVTHDTVALIPFIKSAQRLLERQGKALRLFASPWSPPAWMKTNSQMDHSLPPPCMRLECQGVWARYIAEWVTAYQQHGVPIWAITVQNEPEWNPEAYEACLWTPAGEGDFVAQHLGPVMRAAHPEVAIFGFDHNKHDVHEWARALLGRPETAAFVDGIAFHWYSGDHFDNVATVRREFPQTFLLPSEATFEAFRMTAQDSIEEGNWSFGEGYAHDIMGDLTAGANAWTDWNLLLDEYGGPNHAGNTCDAAMRANVSAQQVFVHPQFYYIAHFSKYAPPGSQLLSTVIRGSSSYDGPPRPYGVCTAEDGLESVAFLRPDRKIAVVAMNCADHALDFKLKDGERALWGSIPAHAIQTYVFDQLDHVVSD